MPVCETNRCYVPAPDSMTFVELWQHLAPELKRLARSMGLAPQAVDDVLQEVFLTATEKCPAHFSADERRLWLIRVVINRCRLEHRRTRRWRSLLNGWSQFWSNHAHESIDAAEQDEQRQLIRAAMDSLAPIERTVLILKYYLDLNSSEISEVLTMPDSTVRSHLRKARWSLADKLKQTGFEP